MFDVFLMRLLWFPLDTHQRLCNDPEGPNAIRQSHQINVEFRSGMISDRYLSPGQGGVSTSFLPSAARLQKSDLTGNPDSGYHDCGE